jgi:hypothetical protein
MSLAGAWNKVGLSEANDKAGNGIAGKRERGSNGKSKVDPVRSAGRRGSGGKCAVDGADPDGAAYCISGKRIAPKFRLCQWRRLHQAVFLMLH